MQISSDLKRDEAVSCQRSDLSALIRTIEQGIDLQQSLGYCFLILLQLRRRDKLEPGWYFQ